MADGAVVVPTGAVVSAGGGAVVANVEVAACVGGGGATVCGAVVSVTTDVDALRVVVVSDVELVVDGATYWIAYLPRWKYFHSG